MRKWQELSLIGIIYVISFITGLFIVSYIEVSLIMKLLILDLILTVLIYLSSILLKNASMYDPFWSVIPPLLILVAMYNLDAFGIVNILLLASVSIWAIRLTYNWAVEWTAFSKQDWRYDLIKDKTKKFYPLASFTGIMLMPTLVVFAQVYVAVEVVRVDATSLSLLTVLSSVIILAATLIQGISDYQMRKFRAKKIDKGIINEGLWKYSRHPNYFAEILVWWGVYCFYIAITKNLNLLILAPLVMILLFVTVSIPMMESKILKTRPHYKKYQDNTSVLIPLPRFKKNK